MVKFPLDFDEILSGVFWLSFQHALQEFPVRQGCERIAWSLWLNARFKF
jgi:hypothetical protein